MVYALKHKVDGTYWLGKNYRHPRLYHTKQHASSALTHLIECNPSQFLGMSSSQREVNRKIQTQDLYEAIEQARHLMCSVLQDNLLRKEYQEEYYRHARIYTDKCNEIAKTLRDTYCLYEIVEYV